MKHIATIVLFIIIVRIGQSQSVYNPLNYTIEPSIYNPAFASSDKCDHAMFYFQKDENQIKTNMYTAGFSFQNPILINKQKKFQWNWHSVGGHFQSQAYPGNANTRINLNYSFHLKVSRSSELSFGTGIGFRRQNFFGHLLLADPNDPVFLGNEEVFVFPEFNFGIWYTSKKWFLGLSTWNIQNKKWKWEKGSIGESNILMPESYLTAGYTTDLAYYIRFSPSILLVNNNLTPPSVSVMGSFEFQDRVILAVGSRNLNSLIGTFQLRFTNKLDFGYSYQHYTGNIASLLKNAHAITVSFNSCGFGYGMESRFYCPAYAMK